MAEIILLIVIAGLVLGGLCLLFVGLGVFQLMMKGLALTKITVIFSLGVLVVLLCLTVGHAIRLMSYFRSVLKRENHKGECPPL